MDQIERGKKVSLVNFIIKAKLSGYAAGPDIRKQKFDDGSQGFEFAADSYRYLDRYYGFNPFSGTEHVCSDDGALIWKMNYYGRVFSAASDPMRIYIFLREAMSLITPAYPFRGPARLEKRHLLYENEQKGTVDNFHGVECIYEDSMQVYFLQYHGGTMMET